MVAARPANLVLRQLWLKIDRLHHPVHHSYQMIFWNQFLQVRRQQARLFHRIRFEYYVSFFHAPIESHFPLFAQGGCPNYFWDSPFI